MSISRRQLLQRAALGLTGSASPLLSAAPLPAAEHDTALRGLLSERLRLEGVGLAAARLLPDGGLQLAADGRAGGDQALLTPDRHGFEIGSISKTFIGLLLADAAVRGELRLDDAVDDSLGFALRDRDGQALRYVDLATHRSGLPRLAPNMKLDSPDPYADYGEAAMLDALRGYRATRRRDEAFEYSNLGFGLLGWLLARRAAQPLATLLERRVLAPLGLGGAGGMQLQLRPRQGPGRVQGHDAQGRPAPAWHFSEATAGAGALLASAAQLARYGQAALGLLQHPLGDAFALALRVHSTLGPGGVQLGLGWMRTRQQGREIATHDGGTAGFASSLWLDLSERRGGLVLANAALSIGDLARHLMDERAPFRDIAAERRATQQAALSLSAEQLAPLAGVYALNAGFKLTLRVDGQRLFAQASGQGEFELFASGPRDFFARVTPLRIRFEGGEPPAALLLEQAGRETRFQRE